MSIRFARPRRQPPPPLNLRNKTKIRNQLTLPAEQECKFAHEPLRFLPRSHETQIACGPAAPIAQRNSRDDQNPNCIDHQRHGQRTIFTTGQSAHGCRTSSARRSEITRRPSDYRALEPSTLIDIQPGPDMRANRPTKWRPNSGGPARTAKADTGISEELKSPCNSVAPTVHRSARIDRIPRTADPKQNRITCAPHSAATQQGERGLRGIGVNPSKIPIADLHLGPPNSQPPHQADDTMMREREARSIASFGQVPAGRRIAQPPHRLRYASNISMLQKSVPHMESGNVTDADKKSRRNPRFSPSACRWPGPGPIGRTPGRGMMGEGSHARAERSKKGTSR